MNLLALINPEHKRKQELKTRILKNKEGVLDALSEGMKGARTCPKLLGQKCIGSFCEFFMSLKSIDDAKLKDFLSEGTKYEDAIKLCTKEFYRCAVVETPLLLIELNESIRNLTAILAKEK